MSRSTAARHRARLAIHPLENRVVPANNITIVDAGTDDSAFVSVQTAGQTTTIFTKTPDAILSLTTIQNAITAAGVTDVVVTTAVAGGGTDGHQAGNIVWDATAMTASDLDFTGFGTGKTLQFQTAAGTNAVGNIDLTGVGFHNAGGTDQISLIFDTSATPGSVGFLQGNGDPVSFDDQSVLDLTVKTKSGGFTYEDAGNLNGSIAGGSISVTAGSVTLDYTEGLTAFGDITVNAKTVTLNAPLDATNNLSVTGTTSVTASSASLTAENGSASVSGGTIGLGSSDVSALTTVTISGTNSVSIDSQAVSGSGDVSITGGSILLTNDSVSGGAKITLNGTGVTVSGTGVSAAGDLSLIGSVSVGCDSFSSLGGANMTLSSPGTVTLSDTDLNASATAGVSGLTVDVSTGSLTAGTDFTVTSTGGSPSIGLTDESLSAGGNITFGGPVELGGSAVLVAGTGRNSVVAFNSSVDGPANLEVASGTVTFGADVGTATPIGTFTIDRGLVDLGTRNLTAAQIQVGLGTVDPFGLAVLAGKGLITLSGFGPGTNSAKVVVNAGGALEPVGQGTVGTLTVFGNLAFNGGTFAVDLGPTSDEVIVRDNPATTDTEGNASIDPTNGGVFGGGLGTGTLPAGSGDTRIIDFAGTFTGQFENAPLNIPVLAGTDAIEVTHYGPAATGMTIAPVAALPNGILTGADPADGTLYTATLTGGGELVGGTAADGNLFLVVRDATAASKLTVVTKANASDTIVTFGAGILINGPLAGFAGPRVNVGTQFRATGPVKSVTMLDLLPSSAGDPGVMSFGGAATDRTSITARNLFGSVNTTATLTKLTATGSLGAGVGVPGVQDSTVTGAAIGTVKAGRINAFLNTPGAVSSVTATGDFFGGVTGASLGKLSAGSSGFGGDIVVNVTGAVGSITGTGNALTIDVTAASVGAVKVAKGGLFGGGTGWNVGGGVAGLSAVQIGGLDLTAKFLGNVKVTGSPDFSGDITGSTFTLTGNDGSSSKYAIKSATAAGNVFNSTLNAQAGNVGPVKVGRFVLSKLYVGYTPGGVFNTGGAFANPGFNLTSFATTAVPTGDPNNPLWAYEASEVVANSIGSVTLSGLSTDNGGTAFGIKVHKNGAVVTVKAADGGFPTNQLGKALTPSATPIGGDFYFVQV